MINRVIKQLLYYDLAVQFALGLVSPVFAVFILKAIPGASLRVIGLATTWYWIARVATTVPLSRLMDRTDGERDEYYFAIVGSFIFSTIPLFYLLATQPWHIYLAQFIGGLANSMAVPAYRILFIDHLDKGKTGFEWSLNDVETGIAIAASAYIGAVLAEHFGFTFLFVFVTILGYLGTILIIPVSSNAWTLFQINRKKKLSAIKRKRSELLHVK